MGSLSPTGSCQFLLPSHSPHIQIPAWVDRQNQMVSGECLVLVPGTSSTLPPARTPLPGFVVFVTGDCIWGPGIPRQSCVGSFCVSEPACSQHMLVVLVVGQGLQTLPWDTHYCALCVGWTAALSCLVLGLSITGLGFLLPPLSLSLWAMGSLFSPQVAANPCSPDLTLSPQPDPCKQSLPW